MSATRARQPEQRLLSVIGALGGHLFLGGPVTHDHCVAAQLMVAIPQRGQHAAQPDRATILADVPPLVLGSPHHPCLIECLLRRGLMGSREQALKRKAQERGFVVPKHALYARVPRRLVPSCVPVLSCFHALPYRPRTICLQDYARPRTVTADRRLSTRACRAEAGSVPRPPRPDSPSHQTVERAVSGSRCGD